MSALTDDAVLAVKRLNPHPDCYAIARWIPQRDRFEFPIIKQPLTDEVALKHVTGQCILGGVASDEEGKTTSVGLDLDAHLSDQRPGLAAKRFAEAAKALDVPIVVHSSKSGKGAHIRTLFSERVPTFLARALYMAIVLASGLSGAKAVDKVWPPTHGLGVLALPYNAKVAKASGGSLALNPYTLQPIEKSAQTAAVLDTQEVSRSELEQTLKSMGVLTEKEAALLSGTASMNRKWDGTAERSNKDGTDGGIQHMMRECAAVERLREEAESATYEFWFGMATNFKPFIGGYELFKALSEIDVGRFKQRDLDKQWRAISGGPRLCSHLESGWTCPKRAECAARSPAGLPFAVQRRLRNV